MAPPFKQRSARRAQARRRRGTARSRIAPVDAKRRTTGWIGRREVLRIAQLLVRCGSRATDGGRSLHLDPALTADLAQWTAQPVQLQAHRFGGILRAMLDCLVVLDECLEEARAPVRI